MGSRICSYCSEKEEPEYRCELSTRESHRRIQGLEDTIKRSPVNMTLIPQHRLLEKSAPVDLRQAKYLPNASIRSNKKPLNKQPEGVQDLLNTHLICESHADYDIIYEGELLKYRPGISYNFIERFGQVTRTHFRLFKSESEAHLFNGKPLDSIPLQAIAKVSSFQISSRCSPHEIYTQSFFELYLLDEDPDVSYSRASINSSAELQTALSAVRVRTAEAAVQSGIQMRRPIRNPANPALLPRLLGQSWTVRELDWFSSEKRLLFTASNPVVVQRWTDVLKTLKRL